MVDFPKFGHISISLNKSYRWQYEVVVHRPCIFNNNYINCDAGLTLLILTMQWRYKTPKINIFIVKDLHVCSIKKYLTVLLES